MPRLLVTGAGAFLALASSLSAHDLWIQPLDFTPIAGTPVAIELRIGDPPLDFEPLARSNGNIARFEALAAGAAAMIPGLDGKVPAGFWTPKGSGLQTLVYTTRPIEITLGRNRFVPYLLSKGLDHIVAKLDVLGEIGQRDQTELYVRSIKSLVVVGKAAADDRDRPAGLPMELVADRLPLTASPGESLGFTLLLRGEPLADAEVHFACLKGAGEKTVGTTDEHGHVELANAVPGIWLVTAVHMMESATDTADWESFWTSLSFQIGVADP